MIYLDNAATTPVDPVVAARMIEIMQSTYGNASSTHPLGQQAATILKAARRVIKDVVGAGSASQVVFTGGATEANNICVRTLCLLASKVNLPIVVSAVEHKSITEALRYWSTALGVRVNTLRVTHGGTIDLEQLEQYLAQGVSAIITQAANSETGVIQPIPLISELAHRHGVPLLADAVQLVGKYDHAALSGWDLLTLSGHKVYGPKGVGAIVTNSRITLEPLILGGGQEYGVRSGTENVPAIAGFAKALERCCEEQPGESIRITSLRNRLWRSLETRISGVFWNGDQPLLPTHLNISISGVEAVSLAAVAREVAFSQGSACDSAALSPSPVLLAMGIDRQTCFETIRLSLGRYTTDAEVEAAGNALVSAVDKIRSYL